MAKKFDHSFKRSAVEDQYERLNKDERRAQELAHARQRAIRGSFWDEVDPRRRQEWVEGGMVREDNRAMANLPTRFIHEEYPEINHAAVYTPDYTVKFFNDDRD